ncbi:MAG: selenide, water dikinase SelD [Bacteroidetes bacterium]|nr:selenide, water dikinase SelD [Bacteroidota bacterium]
MSSETIKLTSFSHGAGCGCKIAPKVLEEILHTNLALPDTKNLLVGNHSNDDAAVYDLGNGTALVSTTDFFTPIVDDPFLFGKVAAANAISDVYAMGGKPLLAIAILGWPVEKIAATHAQRVVEGGRTSCIAAGIPLAGGHSIDSPEPIFGLAVTGIVPIENLKKNNTAQPEDVLLLTKPLGVGILATAEKRGLLQDADRTILHQQLTQLNSIGEALGKIKGVSAMTDVTGFGLMGHVLEMAEGSGCSAVIEYAQVPLIQGLQSYISQRISPDATPRNWNAYSSKVKFEKGVNVMEAFTVLPDPQTNGGLLISCSGSALQEVQALLQANGLGAHINPIGKITAQTDLPLLVK